MRPLIGLTPSVSDNRKQLALNRDYTEAVLRSGALPVILPLIGDSETAVKVIDSLDGIIFTGGADVQPSLYGEEKLPVCGETDEDRDRTEMLLIRECLKRPEFPLLAICRGFEVLNVALGGTLYQDIATQRPGSVRHPCYETPADQVHGVDVVPGSRLHALCGAERIRVNSRHHQGVRTVGSGLQVSARAEDGLIEGLELPACRFAVGVQWHPETLSAFAKEAARLFDGLTAAALEG